LKAVRLVNERQKKILVEKIIKKYGENLKNKLIAVWGLSFKPNTDDMREAPSREVIKKLVQLGAKIQVHDPIALKQAKILLKKDINNNDQYSNIKFYENHFDALSSADFLIIMTEWKIYRNPDFLLIEKLLKEKIIFDGRNLFDPMEMKQKGFEYYGIGNNIN
jgi:UDPglucose 6-dehydrogenase